eukprot:CAMPEP_0119335184 /NCGR_PEP_ID=MMETSP1333-20130426/88926_1 /TAXON_ID=418940 /ORGANISM="Scyphosphaera apsteinii, Strain RCC1455" /LENGTH=155 /DNA_ID=CAMNT_0007345665 /DNA_START=376 /DNA_END=843 /DNA_ORIENTATION=-
MTQYLIRKRRLRLKPQPTLERVHKKVEVREKRREAKAEKAALLDRSIQRELLARLKQGTYGDIYNFPMKEYESALDEEQAQAEASGPEEFVEAESDEDGAEEEEDYEGEMENIEDYSDADEEAHDRKRQKRREYEYEEEGALTLNTDAVTLANDW